MFNITYNILQDLPSKTVLTRATHHELATLYLEHCTLLPDYPRTDPNGYTYCVNMENLKAPTRLEVRIKFSDLVNNVF